MKNINRALKIWLVFSVTMLCFKTQICFGQEKQVVSFTGEVSSNSVNVRSGPGTNFEIINKLHKGDILLVKEQILDWYKIALPYNSKAFVSANFVSSDGGVLGQITAERVNVRAGKGTHFNIVGQLNSQDKIEIVQKYGEWIQIYSYENCFAWINKKYVEQKGPPQVYIEKSKKEQEAYNLLHEAQLFEQKESVGKSIAEDRAPVIQKYAAIVRDYPHSHAAQTAQQHIAEIKKTSNTRPAAVSEPPVTVPKNIAAVTPPSGKPLAEGKLMDVGRFFNRKGTHKLIDKQKNIYFLKSNSIDLNEYIYYQVQIWGKVTSDNRSNVPVIEVMYVKKIN